MQVVVVESPAKAKTINKYLGKDYVVLASFGHVRDLPPKEGSVRPEEDFAISYQTDPRSEKHLKAIADALKGATALHLATDPDREGEAISWHVLQALKEKKAIKDITVNRVVFNEITRKAVTEAMAHPRAIDMHLVNAQQARRALDYLVGFTLSPVLWRKLPGARSAGRVQSVALRLICEREMEVEAFQPREYWSVDVNFAVPSGQPQGGQTFGAFLAQLDGRKLDKFDLDSQSAAEQAAARIGAASFKVADVTVRAITRQPPPPFITSTLQQEASRKLGFTASRTMQLAQRLYEGVTIGGEVTGLITYMRTDSVQMADEAVRGARAAIEAEYGSDYLPAAPRVFKTKAKGAQEAHEAVRPTEFSRKPHDVARYLDDGQAKLYGLIWARAMASQMATAEHERTTVEIADPGGQIGLRASGTVVRFAGFQKLYEEGRDDDANGDDAKRLPPMTKGQSLESREIKPNQHFTEPPPRYSEASLVKKLEELGIGRPSTYASIISVLQERDYVQLDRKRFVPDDKGRVVTAFLVSFFEHYFAYDFTANLEERLDEITEQQIEWKEVLRIFWRDFSAPHGTGSATVKPDRDILVSVKQAVENMDSSIGSRTKVIDTIDEVLGPHFFPPRPDGADPRICLSCAPSGLGGRLGIKLGKNGAFVGCSRYPDCRFTRRLAVGGEPGDDAVLDGPQLLGDDPATGEAVTLRRGPFGLYVQLGEAREKAKPKRVSVAKGIDPNAVDLALALKLLSLPREVGLHPETKEPIVAGLGRFGPYLQYQSRYVKLRDAMEAVDVGINRAVDILAAAPAKGANRRQQPVLHALGAHPEDAAQVNVLSGRYGPYIKHGKNNAPIPRGMNPEEVTLDIAVAALEARHAKPGKASAKGKAKPKTAKPKTAQPKTAGRRKSASAPESAATAKSSPAKRASKKVA
jgi:DNA topoisomerase-1